ncbi:MAG: DUF2589 domain-containing protein [Bacteroidales bacterium]|nr:DUF2589 domain-containing protein [Bacteroidales bacterium]
MDNDIVSMSSGQGSSIVKRYGIADALSELMESAVMADTNAAQKAYDMIRMHAYGLTPDSTLHSPLPSPQGEGSGVRLPRAINSINQHRVSMNMEAEPNNIDDQTALENYEKENEGKLAMAQFTMRDASGAMQEVSIPKITMMPLPLLHVTEATFDLDLSVNLVDTSDKISSEELELVSYVMQYYGNNYRMTTVDQIINQIRSLMQRAPYSYGIYYPRSSGQPLYSSQNQYKYMSSQNRSSYISLEEQLNLMYKYKASANSQIGPGSAFKVSQQGSDANESTTNLKVNIKMKQAELPDGIKLLLQAAANSLQVAAREVKGE